MTPEEIVARAYLTDSEFERMIPERREHAMRCAGRAITAYLHIERGKILGDASLSVNCDTYEVFLRGAKVRIKGKAFDVLKMLMIREGEVVPYRSIMRECWGPAYVEEIQYLRVCMSGLRKVIGDEFITTETGGYRYVGTAGKRITESGRQIGSVSPEPADAGNSLGTPTRVEEIA